MASATTAPLPIYYNTDVHNFYIKQKQEFHFTQKSDNEFLMFLLDTAVRVISIVQHLAPVIEAVSDAGVEVDDFEDEISPIHTPNSTANVSSGAMDVDTITPTQPSALSAELEQINQEITNAQISSQQLPRQPAIPTRRPAPVSVPAPASAPVHVPASVPVTVAPIPVEAEPAMMTASQPTAMLPVSQTPVMLTAAQPSSHTPSTSVPRVDVNPQALPPNVPAVQLPSSAHSSENTSTSLPSPTQPIAEPPDESHSVKTEQPVPEVIEIKEEMNDPAISASSELLSQDTLDQLMSSISGAEDNAGLQNFVPTATPSSLPPSFLDRGAGNPLSMLGSLNSGDGPGPSGLNVPNISESMMKNINDAGLNVSSIKGQANPSWNRFLDHMIPADTPPVHARRRIMRIFSLKGTIAEYDAVVTKVNSGIPRRTALEEVNISRTQFTRKRCIAEAAKVDITTLRLSIQQLQKVTLENIYPFAKDICNRNLSVLHRLYSEGEVLQPKDRY